MKRISITGYVPENEREYITLEACDLVERDLRGRMRTAIPRTKKEALTEFGNIPLKRVRITAEIDVEVLT